MKRILIITAIVMLSVFPAPAQSGHYWTQQYGTRSMLLSGSVIGGVSDLGCVFYNPARLSQVDNPAFLISADVYELNRYRLEDAFGNDANAAVKEFKGVPSLAAGTFELPFLKNHHFAWAILLRDNLNLDLSYKNEVFDDVLENLPGEEHFGAELAIKSKSKEEWMGASWSYSLSPEFSIGISGFYAQVSQNKGNQINLQALSSDNQVAIYRYKRAFNYNHKSLLFKIGASYNFGQAIAGLTILTPRIKLKGDGSYSHELFFSGIEDYFSSDEIYTSYSQKSIPAIFRSAASVGGGLTYFIGKSQIHGSIEWYGPVSNYTLFKTNAYQSQSLGDTLDFRIVDALNPVLNAGLGLELYINENISAFASISTDFSAASSDLTRFIENTDVSYNTTMQADYYHFGAGTVLSIRSAEITVGATYTGASMSVPRIFDFPDEADDDVLSSEEDATLYWRRWHFVLSFSMPFLKDVQKKAEDKLEEKFNW